MTVPFRLAYDAPSDDVARAAAVLRAVASRYGVELAAADTLDPLDTAAAVAGAHLLRTAVPGLTFDRPAGHGEHVTRAVANVLARAAGRAEARTCPPDVGGMIPLALAGQVDAVAAWLAGTFGREATAVTMERVAADLATGHPTLDLVAAACRATVQGL